MPLKLDDDGLPTVEGAEHWDLVDAVKILIEKVREILKIVEAKGGKEKD